MRLRDEAKRVGGAKLIAQTSSYKSEVMSVDVISAEINTQAKRDKLVEQLMNFVDEYQLDGYLIYWVTPGCPKVRIKNFFN